MTNITTEILVVGGGAAGMSAAAAVAECGGSVTILDDNPHLGGQIWRAELGRIKSETASALIGAIDSEAVKIINNAQVFAGNGENRLAAETPAGRIDIEFRKLIIATGARELFLPFPGWTLPGVMGAGGLQALVKGGFNIDGKRVVVAGTGPLLLAVADHLKAKGAVVTAIVEQATPAKINRFARSLRSAPRKLLQAAVLRARLIGVPYLRDGWVISAEGNGKLELINIRHSRKTRTIACDYLACGFHLVPNTELAELVGCELKDGFVAVDDTQRTSKQHIFCAGEPTGIGGVEASMVEGTMAGYAVAGDEGRAKALISKRAKTRRFAEALNRTFALRDELKMLAEETTIVCRCEDVQYGKLKDFENWRSAKLQTRCGMGPCQGRVCGAASKFLFGWEPDGIRPPIFPAKLENL